MPDKLKWDSNNGQVADREFAIARVRAGALELCTDERTGRFVGVHLEGAAPPPAYDFTFTPPDHLEFQMAEGIIDAVNNRLIPFPYPLVLPGGENMPRMYDMVVGGTTYTFDPATQADIVFTSGIFTVTVGFWGFFQVRYDTANAGSLPANGATVTPITVTSFRVSNLAGTVISPAFTNGGAGYGVIIRGQAAAPDTTAPTVLDVHPSGASVALDQDIIINCSENVQAGTGNFYIWDTVANAALETIAAASASYASSQITIPRANAEANSNGYELRWDAGVFKDLANNNVAAEAGGVWQWITAASGGGGGTPPPGTADVIVSTAAALRSLLLTWEGTANWNSTAAGLGKTAADPRTVGIDTAINSDIDLRNMVFPQLVTIRSIGTFANGFSSSVPITGRLQMNNSSNIRWYLIESRAPAGTSPQGWAIIDGASYIHFERFVARGTPYTYSAGNRPTTYCFIYATANTDHIYFKDFVHRYIDASTINWHNGTHTNWNIDGWMGEYHGGDDVGDISTYQSAVGVLDGITVRGLFGDRTRSKLYGKHADGFQAFQAPAKTTNFHISLSVFKHGVWLNTNEIAGNGWQTIFISSGASDAGASTVDQVLFCGGHARGTDKPNGNTMNLTNATFLFGPYQLPYTYGNAPFPSPFGSRGAGQPANYNNGWSIANCYQVVNGLGKANVIKAELGNVIRVVPGSGISTWNFSAVSPDVETLPDEYTSLWQIRPKVGGALDPTGQACGCYDLWNKLYAGDPIVCKSVVGWPVAEMFIKHFDPGNNFAGGASGYTGSYDANGNNV